MLRFCRAIFSYLFYDTLRRIGWIGFVAFVAFALSIVELAVVVAFRAAIALALGDSAFDGAGFGRTTRRHRKKAVDAGVNGVVFALGFVGLTGFGFVDAGGFAFADDLTEQALIDALLSPVKMAVVLGGCVTIADLVVYAALPSVVV